VRDEVLMDAVSTNGMVRDVGCHAVAAVADTAATVATAATIFKTLRTLSPISGRASATRT
jgi:hypothetical protein